MGSGLLPLKQAASAIRPCNAPSTDRLREVAAIAHRNLFPREMSSPVYRRIRLCDEKVLFAVAGEIINLIRHATLFHLAIGCLDKTEFIDAREGAHRTN